MPRKKWEKWVSVTVSIALHRRCHCRDDVDDCHFVNAARPARPHRMRSDVWRKLVESYVPRSSGGAGRGEERWVRCNRRQSLWQRLSPPVAMRTYKHRIESHRTDVSVERHYTNWVWSTETSPLPQPISVSPHRRLRLLCIHFLQLSASAVSVCRQR